ncbi:MAG: isochorismatase family hydrolase [Candidatus Saccharibacteria bacterium]|nr:isochorismatase family hydrolase [Candidatus Saccharibacteria bacterium]
MRSLLLVIDLQKGWRHKTATEAAMLKTVELCKEFSGDIIHCCFKNDPASLFHTQLKWYRFTEPEDTDQIPEVIPLKLPQYWRTTYSCVTDELLPVFQQYDHIYIAGVFTDISVAATAMDIFDHNIPVSVVTDCVATLHGQSIHENSLRSLDYAIGPGCLVTATALIKSHESVL